MPGITRSKSRFSSMKGVRDNQTLYCKICYDVGLPAVLGPRVYGIGEVIPADAENFRQCENCGRVYPLYEIRGESDLEVDIEPLRNPFAQIGDKMSAPKFSQYHKGKTKRKSQISLAAANVYKVRSSRVDEGDPDQDDLNTLIKQGAKVIKNE